MPLRLYLTNAAPGFNPSIKGGWEQGPVQASATSTAVNRKLATAKSGANATVSPSEASASATWDILLGRFISDPFLRFGAITAAEVFTIVHGAFASTATPAPAFRPYVTAYITAGDTNTTRATWFEGVDATQFWPTTTQAIAIPAIAPASTLYVRTGDRLVIEVGLRATNTSTASRSGSFWYGGTGATDLTGAGDVNTATRPAWVQLTGAQSEALWTAPAAGSLPKDILNIGVAGGKNHFAVDVAPNPPAPARILHECSEIEAGYFEDPYFVGSDSNTKVRFRARVDAATTAGSSFARSELRETVPGSDTELGFNPHDGGTHWIRGKSTILHLPPVKPDCVYAQLHDGAGDVIQIKTQITSGGVQRLLWRLNGTNTGLPAFENPYTPGAEFEWGIAIVDGLCRIYYNDMVTPMYVFNVSEIVPTAGVSTFYYKAGAYLQSNETNETDPTEYGDVRLRDLAHWHTGWAPNTLYPSWPAPLVRNPKRLIMTI